MSKVKLDKEDVERIERIKSNISLSDNLKNKMISDILNYRCSKCNSAMEELEEDLEGMSDGQITNYDSGLDRPFYCPKCKSTSLRDVDVFDIDDESIILTPRQLEELDKGRRKSWSDKRIRGSIGESWYANKLRDEGFKVRNTMYYDWEKGISIFNEKAVVDLLKEYPKKEELVKELRSINNGFPDLICLKDNKISFVEVKTNNSKLKENQEETIKLLKSKGYEVNVVRLNVSFSVEEDEKDKN